MRIISETKKELDLAFCSSDEQSKKGKICVPIRLKIGMEYVNLLNINF